MHGNEIFTTSKQSITLCHEIIQIFGDKIQHLQRQSKSHQKKFTLKKKLRQKKFFTLINKPVNYNTQTS